MCPPHGTTQVHPPTQHRIMQQHCMLHGETCPIQCPNTFPKCCTKLYKQLQWYCHVLLMVPPNFTQPTQHRIMLCCCLLHGETHAKQCPNTLPMCLSKLNQQLQWSWHVLLMVLPKLGPISPHLPNTTFLQCYKPTMSCMRPRMSCITSLEVDWNEMMRNELETEYRGAWVKLKDSQQTEWLKEKWG